ncbi:MAG: permease-like cell division protein FtsX, partial [Bacteroidetes bacterium]|nr:permease-like cell division protein FtsX [Bacteroidota bacterium]
MAKTGAGRRTISILSTIVSICLVLFLSGILGIFLLKANEVKTRLKESIEFKVMFRDKVPAADMAMWHTDLAKRQYVKEARFVSKEEALASMKDEFGNEVIDVLGMNPLPNSIELNLIESFSVPDSLISLKKELESHDDIIREVVFQADLLTRIDQNVKRVSMVLIGFVAIFLLIAIALINSTIRLTIYSRRFLVKSMQLVGATRGFIRRPFVWQSILNGLLSGVLACAMLLGVVYLMEYAWTGIIRVEDFPLISLLFASVLVLGFIISWISSYFAINRYLNLSLE